MFTVYCSQAKAEVLLGLGSIEALLGGAGRVEIAYRCSCGERGVWRGGVGCPYGVAAEGGASRLVELPVPAGTAEPEALAG